MVCLDVVVYGASGFTGRLVCNYLRRHAPSGLRWALAGRDAATLESIAADCGGDEGSGGPGGGGAEPREVIGGCDAERAAALLAPRARVVISTAGPFVDYSDKLVGVRRARLVDSQIMISNSNG